MSKRLEVGDTVEFGSFESPRIGEVVSVSTDDEFPTATVRWTSGAVGVLGQSSLRRVDCLEAHDGKCEGTVEYRMSLSGTGTAIPRCDFHWEKRLVEQDRINERYPTHAPSDFDPSYAGERWDDEY